MLAALLVDNMQADTDTEGHQLRSLHVILLKEACSTVRGRCTRYKNMYSNRM